MSSNNRGARPLYEGTGIQELIREHSRAPFQDVLTELLDVMPSQDQMRKFAAANPDKYFTIIAQMSKLAGYSEKVDITKHITLDLTKMSDVELEQRLLEKTKQLSDQRQERDAEMAQDSKQEKSPAEDEALIIDGEYEAIDPEV